jgi:hypothetical protein
VIPALELLDRVVLVVEPGGTHEVEGEPPDPEGQPVPATR